MSAQYVTLDQVEAAYRANPDPDGNGANPGTLGDLLDQLTHQAVAMPRHIARNPSALLQAMTDHALKQGYLLDPVEVRAALQPDRYPLLHAILLDLHGESAARSLADVPGALQLACAPVERDGIVEVTLADGETLRVAGKLYAPPI